MAKWNLMIIQFKFVPFMRNTSKGINSLIKSSQTDPKTSTHLYLSLLCGSAKNHYSENTPKLKNSY